MHGFLPYGNWGTNLQRTIGLKAPLQRALGEPALFPYELGRRGGVSEAVLRIARELPRWRWAWVFHFIPRVVRDAIYDLVAAQPLSLVRPS